MGSRRAKIHAHPHARAFRVCAWSAVWPHGCDAIVSRCATARSSASVLTGPSTSMCVRLDGGSRSPQRTRCKDGVGRGNVAAPDPKTFQTLPLGGCGSVSERGGHSGTEGAWPRSERPQAGLDGAAARPSLASATRVCLCARRKAASVGEACEAKPGARHASWRRSRLSTSLA